MHIFEYSFRKAFFLMSVTIISITIQSSSFYANQNLLEVNLSEGFNFDLTYNAVEKAFLITSMESEAVKVTIEFRSKEGKVVYSKPYFIKSQQTVVIEAKDIVTLEEYDVVIVSSKGESIQSISTKHSK